MDKAVRPTPPPPNVYCWPPLEVLASPRTSGRLTSDFGATAPTSSRTSARLYSQLSPFRGPPQGPAWANGVTFDFSPPGKMKFNAI
jgi:hypothetical protein